MGKSLPGVEGIWGGVTMTDINKKIEEIMGIENEKERYRAATSFLCDIVADQNNRELKKSYEDIIYFNVSMFRQAFERDDKTDTTEMVFSMLAKELLDEYTNWLFWMGKELNADDIDVCMSVAQVVFDLSFKYREVVDVMEYVLKSPDITLRQRLTAYGYLLDTHNSEITDYLGEEKSEKYRKERLKFCPNQDRQ